jgi:hypothetical protein
VPTDRDRAYVKEHVIYLGREGCAKRLGISSKTLDRHFPEEVAEAKLNAKEGLTKTAFQRAMAGDGPMIRWLLSSHFRDEYGPHVRHSHDGNVTVDLSEIDLSEALKDLNGEELNVAGKIIEGFIQGLIASGAASIGDEEFASGFDGSEAPDRGEETGS